MACTGASPSWTCASANSIDVAACITAATTGDTINIPAGAATWSTRLDIGNKDLIFIGAGNGSNPATNTVLTASGITDFFYMNSGSGSQISFIRFIEGTILQRNLNTTKQFRIHHNYFQASTKRGWEVTGGGTDGQPPMGLFDHNTVELVRFVVYGTVYVSAGEFVAQPEQHRIWSKDPDFGGPHAVYFEDNIITGGGTSVSNLGTLDCNYGGRAVQRFNTLTITDYMAHEIHGVSSLNRSCQRWEMYGNTITQTDTGVPVFTTSFIRGGSGYNFGNVLNINGYAAGPALKIERVTEVHAPFNLCDGASSQSLMVDGPLGSGYPCRDSIGHSRDSVLYTGDYNGTTGSGAWPSQPSTPVYTWDNLAGGSQLLAFRFNGTATHNAENRDFYNFSSAVGTPQTVGVRVGALGSRPAGCTTGVGYASTDGTWKTSTPSQGNTTMPAYRLWQCTATDTWGLYFTPYTYPHPLQGAGGGGPDVTPPATPTGLRVV